MLPHDSDQPPTVPGTSRSGDGADGAGRPEPTVTQNFTPYETRHLPGEPTVRAKTIPQSCAEQAEAQHRSDADIQLPPEQAPADHPHAPWPAGLERIRPLTLLPNGEYWLAREIRPDTVSLLAVKITRHEEAAAEVLVLRVPNHDPIDYLGSGTFGEVLLYQERNTGRRVAVKFFTRGGASLEWQLLQAEVKQLALMDDDPGIVQIKDVETSSQPPFYVMTYAEHGSLANRLAEQGTMPVREALRIFRRTADALAYVHAKGLRHCDLKPGNVLLDARDRPLLADFGQAHLASDLSPALGTFFYMAPEQATLEPTLPDPRWDVYSLGALMYALVTGKPPHEDSTLLETLNHTASLPHRLKKYRDWVASSPRPEAHRRVKGMDRLLADIISRCLAVNPIDRPHDAGEVVMALERRRRSLHRKPLLIFGLIAPVVVMLVMTGFGALIGEKVLERAQETLASQLRSNEEVMARLGANVLQNKLDERVAEVERRAADPALIAGLQMGADRAKLTEELERFRKYDRQKFFFKWTLVNPRGFIVADAIHEPQLFGRCWAWRDWFNGTGQKSGAQDRWFAPVEQTYISEPYVAYGIDEEQHHSPLCLSITAPVRGPGEHGKLLALLVATLHFDNLQTVFQHIGLETMHGDVVILNQRKQCLMHEDMAEVKRRIPPDRDPIPVPDSPVLEELIDRQQEGSASHCPDPLTGKDCLAGFAPMKGYGWGVLVLYERSETLHPVANLRGWLASWGICLLVIMSVVTTGLWGAMIWTLRQEEKPTKG